MDKNWSRQRLDRYLLINFPVATKSGNHFMVLLHGCSRQVYTPLAVARTTSISAREQILRQASSVTHKLLHWQIENVKFNQELLNHGAAFFFKQRIKEANSTYRRPSFPYGLCWLRPEVARFMYTKEPQGGPNVTNPSGTTRSTPRTACAKPVLGPRGSRIWGYKKDMFKHVQTIF